VRLVLFLLSFPVCQIKTLRNSSFGIYENGNEEFGQGRGIEFVVFLVKKNFCLAGALNPMVGSRGVLFSIAAMTPDNKINTTKE
jgi:hypothetical protein